MNFHPFEVTIAHIIYACLGGFVVVVCCMFFMRVHLFIALVQFGMFSLLLRERLYIGEACWAFLFGVIIGPYCANIFDPRSWGDGSLGTVNTITLEFTRIVLAIGVFAIGVELPKAYMKRHWRSLFFLLFPVMTWGWFVSAGLIYAFIPGLNFLSSLAVAACLTPTDPILAAAVVGGKWADKHVPAHIRHLLAAESGCNDGAAYPFLFISLYLILDKNTGHAIRDWFLLLWLYQVILGIVIGGLLGFAFRHLMKFCERHDLIDRHSYVAQYLSLAMLTIGVCSILGSDDLLAAFSCGTAFAWDGFFNRQTEESVFSSVIDLLFNIAAFVFVGAWMPFETFQDTELTLSVWRLIAIAILVLLLRRLPILVALYKFIPDVKTFRESLFTGHFGPIGVGAVFISTLAAEILYTGHDNEAVPYNEQTELLRQTIQPIVGFMVLCSITIHGLSIPGFSLGRRVHSVSRTWSRRETETSEAVPDWTNQTLRVTHPEQIVINRDHVDLMEKGFLGTTCAEELRKTHNSSRTEIDISDIENQQQHTNVPDIDEGSTETRVSQLGDHLGKNREDYREETVPDGEENYQEWIEPHHRIIEQSPSGAGSDVDVVVINDEETPSISRSGLYRPPDEPLYQSFEEASHGIAGTTKNAEEELEIKSPPNYAKDVTPPQSPPFKPCENDDDDEGWASETSDSDQRPTAGPSSFTGRVEPPTSMKEGKKRQRTSGTGGRKSRHLVSLRRTFAGSNLSTVRDNIVGDDERGAHRGHVHDSVSFPVRIHPRSLASRASQSRLRMSESAAVNQRLKDIKLQASRPPTRETSPSRSVRFVDERLTPENSSRTSAPRGSKMSKFDLSLLQPLSTKLPTDAPGPPTPTSEKSGGSADPSPR